MAKRGPHRLPHKCSVDNCETLTTRTYKKIFYCKTHLGRIYDFGSPEPVRFQDPSITGKSFCYKCKTEKEVSEFSKSSAAKYGISRNCLSCQKSRYSDKQCSVEGCQSNVDVKSKIDNNYYCNKHNERLRKNGHEYLLYGKPKGRASFIHPNYKPTPKNSETFFCRNCGEEKLSKDSHSKHGNQCKPCVRKKSLQKNLFIKSIIPDQSIIKEIPSYLLCLSNKDDVAHLTAPGTKPGTRVTCKAEGCFEEANTNWKFCTKHRYYQERFGSEIPPATLRCPKCEQEKPFDEFLVNGRHHVNTSGLCNQCLVETRKLAKFKKNKERRERRKKNQEKYTEYKRKQNKIKQDRIKKDPIAREKKRKSHRVICINRRARKAGNGGTHTQTDIQFLFESQKGKCVCCRKSIEKKYHVDHIIPIAMGGGSNRKNLQLLCPTCNMRKNALHPIEFMQRNGYLL